jgi:hypothetical protein
MPGCNLVGPRELVLEKLGMSLDNGISRGAGEAATDAGRESRGRGAVQLKVSAQDG